MVRALLSILLISLVCMASLPAFAQDSIKLQLRWTHQFQFAGYYVAKELGYFAEAGFDVEIIPGGPSALRPIEDLLSGQVDFAITGSGVVIDRMEGKPVVAIASIMQTSPIVWITLKSNNIREPQDLAGHKLLIMPPPESAELLTMLEREGVGYDSIDIVPTTYNIDDLIDGKAAAYDGYISNEPYLLEQRGIEYNLLNPRDYGINFYSDVLITRQGLAEDNPELVARFRDASLKGWEYALLHLEEVVDLIQRKYAPNKSKDHLMFEARTIRKLVMPELVQVGHMNPQRWQFIAESYRNLAMTNAEPTLDGFIFHQETIKNNYTIALAIALISAIMLCIAGIIIYKIRKLSGQLKKANNDLKVMATVDQLTKLRNRHGFYELAPMLLAQAKRDEKPSSFIIFDIDEFKSINDEFGHPAGDQALRMFGEVLSKNRRKQDIVARLGGEEFGLLLAGANLEAAEEITQSILNDLRQLDIAIPNTNLVINITASAGISVANERIEIFWHHADKALYQAKHLGKDRYCIAAPQQNDVSE